MSALHFGEPAYWDLRYDEELQKMSGLELYDWYASYEEVHQILETIIDTKVTHRVLILGVGRSNIIDVLYNKGYREIVAIDISPTIINAMQGKYHDYSGVEFFVMDARELHVFSDESFSLVIDKGCSDSIFCDAGLYESFHKMCSEVFRVLRPEGGTFAMISHAPPAARVPYLRCMPWAVDSCALPQSEEPTLYTLIRTTNEELLAHRVTGGEAHVRLHNSKDKNTIIQTDIKPGGEVINMTGKVLVTAPAETVLKMVMDAEDNDLDFDYYSEEDNDDD